ncbi:TlpA family protein disulfide reductase [Blastopirellula marina]|uniref:Putative lipoprotein/thioderoxin n=1 Tax=Blastopirellula marina DSM 3645 TaxID=314230 RepID=A3ZWL0_9BACT|nr:TlpA disulfide reductase family protein [Blastopirellula marina]EAQ78984.1 putative lipoprotein/thioderoxin [Blastopirellula marina DSM 3645]
MKRMPCCLVLAVVIFVGRSAPVWSEEPQTPAAEQAESAPITLDRQLLKLRVNLFEVEGATLEERQTAFRKKLSDAMETVNPLLAEDQDKADQAKLYRFKTELLRYGVRVDVTGAKEELESLLSQLDQADSPTLQSVAEREGLLYHFDSFSTLEVEEQRELMRKATAYLMRQAPESDSRSFAHLVAKTVAAAKDSHAAAEVHEHFAEFFRKMTDPQSQDTAERFLASARRLHLPGSPMELTGTTMDGKPLALSDLKQKVVLVDFWATWCGPCVAEFPKLREHYAKYGPHGFEIVGVSLDENHEYLKQYVEKNEIPWIVLHEEGTKETRGWNHPTAKLYGINSIPCMILIGADGNVITTYARGEELERQLKSLFPDVESTES